MGFMIGRNPIIRTKRYLEAGRVYLNNNIKVFTAHYNDAHCPRNKGLAEFVVWHVPQIQFKNPDVHCIVLRNLTPTPLIRVFLEDGSDVLIDVDSKERREILNHVIQVLGKPSHILKEELIAKEKKENPANFGYLCPKACMCRFFGQVPCPALVPVPEFTRGKWVVKNILKK